MLNFVLFSLMFLKNTMENYHHLFLYIITESSRFFLRMKLSLFKILKPNQGIWCIGTVTVLVLKVNFQSTAVTKCISPTCPFLSNTRFIARLLPSFALALAFLQMETEPIHLPKQVRILFWVFFSCILSHLMRWMSWAQGKKTARFSSRDGAVSFTEPLDLL